MTRPLVAVLLGTDHHPFDRLVRWTQALARTGAADWFVQHGSTELPATMTDGGAADTLTGARMLSGPELEDLLDRADAVVTHGGPGLIMEARSAGHVPVVVARAAAYGEHVDDHQQRFAAKIVGSGLVAGARTQDQLEVEVARALARGRGGDLAAAGIGAGARAGAGSGGSAARFGALVDQLVRHA